MTVCSSNKFFAFVAQLVEQWFEVPRVGGSTPSEGTTSLGLSGVNREPAEYGLQAKPLNLTYEQQDIRSQKLYAGMVELADTLVLGTSASAWGFKSLYPYQIMPD